MLYRFRYKVLSGHRICQSGGKPHAAARISDCSARYGFGLKAYRARRLRIIWSHLDAGQVDRGGVRRSETEQRPTGA